jgi:hypothetical protein
MKTQKEVSGHSPKYRHKNKKYFQSQQKGQKGRGGSERGEGRPMAVLRKIRQWDGH